MKHLSAPHHRIFRYGRRGALLLALGGLAPAAGAQSFAAPVLYATGLGSAPRSIALGDVNRDGRADIVTAYSGTGAAGVLLGQATGFAAAQAYSLGLGTHPLAVVLSDTNRDGLLDIVSANNDYNPGHAAVLLGQAATPGFGAVGLYTTSPVIGPCAVAAGDVNADGYPDIVTVNNFTNDASILTGRASGFAPFATVSTGVSSMPIEVALGDVNGDGLPDLVTANANRTAGVLLNQAGGGFGTPTLYATGALSTPRGLALGDVNGDGRVDIVAANDGSGYVGVLLGQATGFGPVVRYPTGGSFSSYVALGDVNGDGLPDIVATDYVTNNVGILLGQAGGGFTPPRTYPTGISSVASQPLGLALADVNGDGRLDIITANSNSNNVGVLLNTGTYTPLATARPSAADLDVYPNPAHDAFTVQLPAGLLPTQAELLNALGQVVRRPAVGIASFRVETSGLAPGLYTLRLQAGGATLARRVAVE